MALKRRKEKVARPHRVYVRLSDEEYGQLAGTAAVVGLPAARVLWESFDVGGDQAARELRILNDGLDRFNSLVAATGRNINQIARQANVTGVQPVDAAAAIAGLEVLSTRLAGLVADARGAATGRARAAVERGAAAS